MTTHSKPEDRGSVAGLELAFRQLVQEELAKARSNDGATSKASGQRGPTWVDLAMLSMVAADCTLVLVLIPSLNNSTVETFMKVAQWTGATVFVAAAAWFQEQFLAITRRSSFRAIAAATLILLLPQKVPLVPILVPIAAEPVADLKLDAESIAEITGRRMVTIGSHTLATTIVETACVIRQQPTLTIGWTELVGAVRHRRVVPVYYNVAVNFPDTSGSSTTLRIKRLDIDLDAEDFRVIRSSRLSLNQARPERTSPREFALYQNSEIGASSLNLPNGNYELTLTAEGHRCLGRRGGQLRKLLGAECVIDFAGAACDAH